MGIQNESEESHNLLKRFKTLCYIYPNYVQVIFNLIVEEAENLNEQDIQFVKFILKKHI